MVETTIKIYKRLNGVGKIIGWSAKIKVPGLWMWTDVRRDPPADFYGSIYPTKDATVAAAA
jgi:hypothetical protein